jgi:hypothetical protein
MIITSCTCLNLALVEKDFGLLTISAMYALYCLWYPKLDGREFIMLRSAPLGLVGRNTSPTEQYVLKIEAAGHYIIVKLAY